MRNNGGPLYSRPTRLLVRLIATALQRLGGDPTRTSGLRTRSKALAGVVYFGMLSGAYLTRVTFSFSPLSLVVIAD